MAPTYTWRDVNIIPAQVLPPKALVIALTPLVDSRLVAALSNLRARGFDLVVIEVDPVPLTEPGRSEVERLAYRLWLLEREVARSRLEQLGVAIARWNDEHRARDGARGGEDIQATRQAGTRISTGLGAIVVALGLVALPLWRTENDELLEAGWRLAAFALLALVIAVVHGWTPFLIVSLGVLGGYYGLQLAVADRAFDLALPLVAVGLLLTAELAYWSLEEREPVEGDPGDGLRRLAFVAALALATFVLSTLLLVLVDVVQGGGLALDLVGAAAAAGVVVAVLVLARRA